MSIFERSKVFRLGRIRGAYLAGLNGEFRLAQPSATE